MDRVVKYVRVPLWLGALAYLSWLLWQVAMGVLGSEWFAAPVTVLFALFALLAGPPYWRPPHRWRLRLVRVPEGIRRGGKLFGRIPLWRLEKVVAPGKRFGVFRFLSLCAALGVVAAVGLVAATKAKFAEVLPDDVRVITGYDPTVATRAWSADGEHICTFSRTYRVRVPFDRIPEKVRNAVLAAEDDQFYAHRGIRPLSMLRALLANEKAGQTRQGGSTIDMQVVKMLTGDSERTYKRKLKEALLSLELNRRLTKDQIFEIYLNNPFFGREAYGIAAAAEIYFGKSLDGLTDGEAALLAGLIQAPSRHSPLGDDPSSMRARTRYVLDRQVLLGTLTPRQRDDALAEQMVFVGRRAQLNHVTSGYVCEMVRKEVTREYGEKAVYEEGLTIRTTIDMARQRAAEASVRWGLRDLERRTKGFPGPTGFEDLGRSCGSDAVAPVEDYGEYAARVIADGITPQVCIRGNVFTVHPDDARRIASWEKRAKRTLRIGDLFPAAVVPNDRPKTKKGEPERYAIISPRTSGDGQNALQGTFVALDPRTGTLTAIVGGYDFVEDQVNFATMERRQVGSLVKVAVYAAALEGTDAVPGINVDEKVYDRPVSFPSGGTTWSPRNYEGKFKGLVPLRTALALSLNSVSAQLTAKYGPKAVTRMLQRMGVSSELVPVLPISVGAADITPMEMAVVFATIASGGREIPRHPGADIGGVFITEVRDRNGLVLPGFAPPPPREEWPQALDPADAYALTYLMRGVVEEGTGRGIRVLRRPAAGKTGTNRDVDVWFGMFTTDLVASTWVGYKRPAKIGSKATGGSVALPICLAAVKKIHPDTPATDFPVPGNVLLLPGPGGDLVPYKRGRVPERYLPPASREGSAFIATSPF